MIGRRALGAAFFAMGALVLSACGGNHAGSVLPPTSLIPMAISRSPASVPAPPMLGLTGTRPEMSLRKPQSEISALNFTQISGAAVYVAASPDGTFWVLSTFGLPSGDKYIYHYTGGGFVNVPGAATRIAVGPDGTPWVINAEGGIYHLVNGVFTGIAGGASELSVGGTAAAPLVDVISNQAPGPFGAGIYQYNVNAGTWSQLPGAGVTVAASIDSGTYPALNINPGGFYVTNQIGGIYYYNVGVGFEQLPGGAIRLAPTASGGLFALGDPGAYQHGIYYNDLSTGQWTAMPGAAVSISANSQDIYAIGAAGGIYVSPITAGGSSSSGNGPGVPLNGPTTGPPSVPGWSPTSVANALQFPVQSGWDGSGFSVAIIDDNDVYGSDILNYLSYFGIPRTKQLQVELVDNASQAVNSPEATLDVETVSSLAPGANVLLYVIPQLTSTYYNDALNSIISSKTANIVSMSFAGCEEAGTVSQDGTSAIFQAGSAAGIAFVAASGDQGNECYNTAFQPGVGYPASDPNVTGVGGNETGGYQRITTLTSTTAWNDDYTANGTQQATGGGVSGVFALPSYQAGISGLASPVYRNVPDIALPAEDDTIYYQSKYAPYGGTSWSAPLYAAMLAGVYEYCNATFTSAAAIPYYVYRNAGYADFIDVVSGNNQYGGTFPFYSAQPGYDNVTGIGVPYGMPLAKTLCPNRVPPASISMGRTAQSISRRPASAFVISESSNIPGLVDRGARASTALTQVQLVLQASPTVAADESTAVGVLQNAGLTVTKTFSNHLVVDAVGTASSVERLFDTQLDDVDQPEYPSRYMPVSGVTVPAALAPFIAAVNVDNLVKMHDPIHSAAAGVGGRTP